MSHVLWLSFVLWALPQDPPPATPPPATPPVVAPAGEIDPKPIAPDAAPAAPDAGPVAPDHAAQVEAELALARCQLAVREDRHEQAVESCTRALKLDPGLRRAFLWRAQALWRLARHDDAIAEL